MKRSAGGAHVLEERRRRSNAGDRYREVREVARFFPDAYHNCTLTARPMAEEIYP